MIKRRGGVELFRLSWVCKMCNGVVEGDLGMLMFTSYVAPEPKLCFPCTLLRKSLTDDICSTSDDTLTLCVVMLVTSFYPAQSL